MSGSKRPTVLLIKAGERLPLNGDWAPMRTGRLGTGLAAAGHDVVWVTSTFDWRSHEHVAACDLQLRVEGLTIHALRTLGYQRNVSLRRFLDVLYFVIRTAWLVLARRIKPDVVVAAFPTPENVIVGWLIARWRNASLIADVRDLFPDDNVGRIRGIPFLGRAIHRIFAIEVGLALRLADHVVAISPDFLRWARSLPFSAGIDGTVVPIGCSAIEHKSDEASVPDAIEAFMAAWPCIAIFVGTGNGIVDFRPVSEAVHHLDRMDDVTWGFVMCGTGSEFDSLRGLTKGSPRVLCPGFVPPPAVSALLARSHVGLALYRPQRYTAMGNKYFEYLSAGLVVVTTEPAIGEHLAEAGLGCGFEGREVEDVGREFADQLSAAMALTPAPDRWHYAEFIAATDDEATNRLISLVERVR